MARCVCFASWMVAQRKHSGGRDAPRDTRSCRDSRATRRDVAVLATRVRRRAQKILVARQKPRRRAPRRAPCRARVARQPARQSGAIARAAPRGSVHKRQICTRQSQAAAAELWWIVAAAWKLSAGCQAPDCLSRAESSSCALEQAAKEHCRSSLKPLPGWCAAAR